jgi:hypothetical protein
MNLRFNKRGDQHRNVVYSCTNKRTAASISTAHLLSTADVAKDNVPISPTSTSAKGDFNFDLQLQELEKKWFPVKSKTEKSGFNMMPGSFCKESFVQLPNLDLDGGSELEKVLCDLATSSKESSMSLQGFVSECSQSEAKAIGERLAPFYELLITHQFGNYVLQRLIAREATAKAILSELCKQRISTLVQNEYSSRVMQLLIENSPEFRVFTADFFGKHFAKVVNLPPACHLLIACIKNSSSISELDFIIEYLVSQPYLFHLKSVIRILYVYLPVCSQGKLDELVTGLRIKKKILSHLSSKSVVSILIILLQRNQAAITTELFKLLKYHPDKLFETEFLKDVLAKIFDENPHGLRSRFGNAILGLSARQVYILRARPDLLEACRYFALSFVKLEGGSLAEAFCLGQLPHWALEF